MLLNAMTGTEERLVGILVNKDESNLREPSTCGRQRWSRRRTPCPRGSKTQQGMEDEFHIVQESSLKYRQNKICR